MEINQAINITKKLFSVNITKKQYIYHNFHKTTISALFGREKIDF